MATIDENIATINTAIYGEDMRGAIHDALDGVYDLTKKDQQTLNKLSEIIPTDDVNIKTRLRIAVKGETSGVSDYHYYPLVRLPKNDSNNSVSVIISGRIGGHTGDTMSLFQALIWNRNETGISALNVAGTATDESDFYSVCDFVIYKDTTTQIETVYIRGWLYYAFDINVELYQSTAEIIYDGTYISEQPAGIFVTSASTETRRISFVNGALLLGGTDILTGKADLSDVYTKYEIAELLSGKANISEVYTKTEINALLADKQNLLTFDQTPTAGSLNPVTSSGIRAAIHDDPSEVIYGFHIDSTESDPSACVTYLRDAIGLTPAYMDFANDVFRWGGWANAFFLPKPCMLRYDGTVDYYLDPDDYSKKADGTDSDVTDASYQGNAMMEWGQGSKKIWYKIVPDAGDNTSASVYIANYQADSGYHAWPFINNQGELVDHFYTPIYNGSIDGDGRLRSLSGIANTALSGNLTVAQEVAAAELNNPGADKLWFTEVYADVTLINLLLILMGKSLNVQTTFGNGRINQASAAENMLGTGTMNTRGLFWGSNGNNDGVKVFGMENWWGNQWRRYAGHVLVDYVHKYKMTRGTEDGSTASDYNTTGNGYLVGESAPQTNNYVTKMAFDGNCFMTKEVGGNSATYWCDYWYQKSGTRYALHGGPCDDRFACGAFFVNLYGNSGYTYWGVGAAPSCKPLKGV